MGFSAGQHGGIGLAPPGREVIHAQHTRRAGPRVRQCHDPAQQGHPPRATHLISKPCTGPSDKREPDAFQDVAQPCGEACVWGGQLRRRLDERTARAIDRAAEEPPDCQPDHDVLPTERQVLQASLVGAVPQVRATTAVRT